ncbi:MAG: hypothetical protein ACQCN3_02680 [Candidatus Bathyarchaeia archaeon]
MPNNNEKFFIKLYQQPPNTGQYYIIDLDNAKNVELLLEKLGVTDRLNALSKKIDALQSARFQLQKACLPQLVASLKPQMLQFIEKTYPTKAFKEYPVRYHFDDFYGFEACLNAYHELIAEGKITYNRGWNRLAKTEKQLEKKTDAESQ